MRTLHAGVGCLCIYFCWSAATLVAYSRLLMGVHFHNSGEDRGLTAQSVVCVSVQACTVAEQITSTKHDLLVVNMLR
jgi:hypothetical protein